MDLISSVNKVISNNLNEHGVTVQIKNDLQLKIEKLQNELTTIDDELFELEKKYGEYQKPPTILVQKSLDLEKSVDEEDKKSDKSQGEIVNVEEQKSSASSPVVIGEVKETQEVEAELESEDLDIETLK